MENYSKDLKDKTSPDSKRGSFEGRNGRIMGGVVLVVIGGILLLSRSGLDIPSWVLSWHTLPIGIGLFVGARHGFRGFGWMIPIVIGTFFLIDDLYPEFDFHNYMWPVMIICFGLFMILRPKHKRFHDWESPEEATDDKIDATSIFGGTRKNIITKNFKGGDITTLFGGTDLNLMQADIQGTVTIDVTQIFGGTKLIVPPHWNIKSDVVCIFGAIEDKRPQAKDSPDPTKVLRLDGTCIFGGIDIKSY